MDIKDSVEENTQEEEEKSGTLIFYLFLITIKIFLILYFSLVLFRNEVWLGLFIINKLINLIFYD